MTVRPGCVAQRRPGTPPAKASCGTTEFLVQQGILSYDLPEHGRYCNESMAWKALAKMLNVLVSTESQSRHEDVSFPMPGKEQALPFPEDWALRGLVWGNFFPKAWFNTDGSMASDGERYRERASLSGERKERILWLATRIAETENTWLVYHRGEGDFGVRDGYERADEAEHASSDEGSIDESAAVGPV